jgi:hypothetical protein
MPSAEDWLAGYAVAIRWPHSVWKALETAASDHKTSIAGYIEGSVLLSLVAAGLIEAGGDAD